MKPIKPAGKVVFSNDNLEKTFNDLPENDWLKKALKRAIEDLKTNAFCGECIAKDLIPKEYLEEYKINNLYWYPLPNGWRLVYSLMNNEIVGILAVIIEYFNHKDYERRFKY